MDLECSDLEKDYLDFRENDGFVEHARQQGDDTLHFSGEVDYMYTAYDVVETGSMVLTDQGLYLFDEAREVQHMIENACVLSIFKYSDTRFIRLETDTDELLIQCKEEEHTTVFLDTFYDEVLPLEVEEHDTIAPYAAEKELPIDVCAFMGLDGEDVKEHTVVDPVTLLEEKRQIRLEEERAKIEEVEQRREEAKEELKLQLARDKEAADKAHEKGMKRLSIKRQKSEKIDRAMRRALAADGERPSWWEGEWNKAQDPFTMEEVRMNRIAENIQRELDRQNQERLEKLRGILDQVCREESNRRKIVEGELRIAFAEQREEFDKLMARQRKYEREWQAMSSSVISILTKDETPSRNKIMTDEDSEWQRLKRQRIANVSKLDAIARLLRSTTENETKMRNEIIRMEAQHWNEMVQRKAKSRRKKLGKKAATIVEPAFSADSSARSGSDAPSGTLGSTLLERTQSVRRRHLMVHRAGKRHSMDSGFASPTSPTSQFSEYSMLGSEDIDSGPPRSETNTSPESSRPASPIASPASSRLQALSPSPSPRKIPAVKMPMDFMSRRYSMFEDWQNDIRQNIGKGAVVDDAVRKSVACAVLSVLACSMRVNAPLLPPGCMEWEPDSEPPVVVRPSWSSHVLYTYKSLQKNNTTFSSHRNSSAYSRHSSSPPPAYGQRPSESRARRSASPSRNLSPLRGGGTLCGSLCVVPPPPMRSIRSRG